MKMTKIEKDITEHFFIKYADLNFSFSRINLSNQIIHMKAINNPIYGIALAKYILSKP